MFHGRSANEVALASAAIVLALVQRLEKKGTSAKMHWPCWAMQPTDLSPILPRQQ